MNLYEVIRWGNDSSDTYTGGPNGPDTCFLVRAESPAQAAALVDPLLGEVARQDVASWSGAIYLIGEDFGTEKVKRLLRGPYVQHAYRYGWRQWHRESPDDPWQER